MDDGRLPGPEPLDDPQADIDLFCPHCDYNVKGLPENRCPECGTEFDRERLARWATERDLPLTFTRSGAAARPGWALLASITHPAALGRNLPPFPDWTTGAVYGAGTRAAGAFTLTVVVAIATQGRRFELGLLLSVAMILASCLCEVVIALILARLVEPLAVPRRERYRFWRTLCRCFSLYFPISCLLVGLLPVAFPLALVWWCVSLARAIAARGQESAGRTLAIWLIPVVGLAAVALVVLFLVLIDTLV